MSLDQDYHRDRYGIRRDVLDAEDDAVLISRARDVISRATDQLPQVQGAWDRQRLITSGWESSAYSSSRGDTDDRVRSRHRNEARDYDEPGYHHEEKKSRTRNRRRERRRDERRAQSEKPCRTILIKHLPVEVDEAHLRGILQLFGSPIQDVRLVKHKDSGASRGFAFVEFQFLPDAQRWMEENQGVLVIGDGRATLTYSKSRGDEDWFCSQCGTQNFKRRANCFKCGIEKNESERYSQISVIPTRILLLMGLDSLTSEEKVQKELHEITAVEMNIQLIRDPTTNMSRGLCYVALSTIEYASHLLEIIANMQPPFMLDGKQISVHYCKEGTEEDYSAWTEQQSDVTSQEYYDQYYQQTEASTAVAAAAAAAASQYDQSYAGYTAGQYTVAAQQQQQQELSAADKAALAQEQVQAARKMQLEQQHITKKLLNKMRQGPGTEKKSKKAKVDIPPPGTDDEALAQNQVVDTAVTEQPAKATAVTTEEWSSETEGHTLQHQTSSTSSDGSYYPDTSHYQYDETSGFYYDPQTGLYYDPNSQYYYNTHTQQYMYWDGTQYVPAPHQGTVAPPKFGEHGPVEKEKEDKNKKEKSKMAKKVASDMRRWAETMNEMKNVKAKKSNSSTKKDNSSATADAGFAVLSKRADPAETKQSVMLALKRSATSEDQRKKQSKSSIINILAQYGGDSDSDHESDSPPSKKQAPPNTGSSGGGGSSGGSSATREAVPNSLTDWSKLICLLCKRQFPSKEVLVKHQQFSDLHKQNLEALKKRTGLQSEDSNQGEIAYRDRAQERRSRFSYK